MTNNPDCNPKAVARKLGTYGQQRISDKDGAPMRRTAAPEAIAALRWLLDACDKQVALDSEFVTQHIALHLDGRM